MRHCWTNLGRCVVSMNSQQLSQTHWLTNRLVLCLNVLHLWPGFFSWMVHHKDTSCFRPSEKDLYEYMQHLRHTGAGPTAASHFEQAFRMCHEVLGMLHVDIKQVLSPRVTGAAHTMFLGKRKLIQAPALLLAGYTDL